MSSWHCGNISVTHKSGFKYSTPFNLFVTEQKTFRENANVISFSCSDAKELNPSIDVADDGRVSNDDEDSDGFTKPSSKFYKRIQNL